MSGKSGYCDYPEARGIIAEACKGVLHEGRQCGKVLSRNVLIQRGC